MLTNNVRLRNTVQNAYNISTHGMSQNGLGCYESAQIFHSWKVRCLHVMETASSGKTGKQAARGGATHAYW